MKVAELRKELKAKGLPLHGTKEDLEARLKAADSELEPGSTDGEESNSNSNIEMEEDSLLGGDEDDELLDDADQGETLPTLIAIPIPPELVPPTKVIEILLSPKDDGATIVNFGVEKQAKDDAANGNSDVKDVPLAPVSDSPPRDPRTLAKVMTKTALEAEEKAKLREVKFGKITVEADSVATPDKASNGASATPESEALQKRKARFGAMDSTTTAPEKGAGKTGGINPESAPDSEILAKRKARFGSVAADDGKNEVLDEKRLKRAERFHD